MRNFKVGDKIRIKTWEELLNEGHKEETWEGFNQIKCNNDICKGRDVFLIDMKYLSDKIIEVTIENLYSDGTVTGGDWWIEPWMCEFLD